MVGGLVEQQDIRSTHQSLRKIQTHTPSTGKAVDRLIKLFGTKAQPVK